MSSNVHASLSAPSDGSPGMAKSSNIIVAVRVRPFSHHELALHRAALEEERKKQLQLARSEQQPLTHSRRASSMGSIRSARTHSNLSSTNEKEKDCHEIGSTAHASVRNPSVRRESKKERTRTSRAPSLADIAGRASSRPLSSSVTSRAEEDSQSARMELSRGNSMICNNASSAAPSSILRPCPMSNKISSSGLSGQRNANNSNNSSSDASIVRAVSNRKASVQDEERISAGFNDTPQAIVSMDSDNRTLNLMDPKDASIARTVFTFDYVFSHFSPSQAVLRAMQRCASARLRLSHSAWNMLDLSVENDTDNSSNRGGNTNSDDNTSADTTGTSEAGAMLAANMDTGVTDADRQRECRAEAEQWHIFQTLGLPLVDSAFGGHNTCIFVYGQTGSGKTYTMLGSSECAGLIPRTCREVFARLSKNEEQQQQQQQQNNTTNDTAMSSAMNKTDSDVGQTSRSAHIGVILSALEIYNEQVQDLLKKPPRDSKSITPRVNRSRLNSLNGANADRTGLKVRNHPLQGPFVEGLTKKTVHSYAECEELLRQSLLARTHGSTAAAQARSKRSHAIFQIELVRSDALRASSRTDTTNSDNNSISGMSTSKLISRMSLVDLAGSEPGSGKARGEKYKTETSSINVSLMTLRHVIEGLVSNNSDSNKKTGGGGVVIPFRESVLTYLMSESFGGNSKTVMCTVISPSAANLHETESALRYATLARAVRSRVKVKSNVYVEAIRGLQEHVRVLEAELMRVGPPERVVELRMCVAARESNATAPRSASRPSLGGASRSQAHESMANRSVHVGEGGAGSNNPTRRSVRSAPDSTNHNNNNRRSSSSHRVGSNASRVSLGVPENVSEATQHKQEIARLRQDATMQRRRAERMLEALKKISSTHPHLLPRGVMDELVRSSAVTSNVAAECKDSDVAKDAKRKLPRSALVACEPARRRGASPKEKVTSGVTRSSSVAVHDISNNSDDATGGRRSTLHNPTAGSASKAVTPVSKKTRNPSRRISSAPSASSVTEMESNQSNVANARKGSSASAAKGTNVRRASYFKKAVSPASNARKGGAAHDTTPTGSSSAAASDSRSNKPPHADVVGCMQPEKEGSVVSHNVQLPDIPSSLSKVKQQGEASSRMPEADKTGERVPNANALAEAKARAVNGDVHASLRSDAASGQCTDTEKAPRMENAQQPLQSVNKTDENGAREAAGRTSTDKTNKKSIFPHLIKSSRTSNAPDKVTPLSLARFINEMKDMGSP